jgi:hypothetical protein
MKEKIASDMTKLNPKNTNLVEEEMGPWSFVAHHLLGTGSFGEVYLVEKLSDHSFYAMKVLSKQKVLSKPKFPNIR